MDSFVLKVFTRINSNEKKLIEYTQNILFKKMFLQSLINRSIDSKIKNNYRLPSL